MVNFFIVGSFITYSILSAFLGSGEEGGRVVVADLLLIGLIIFAFFFALGKGRFSWGKIHEAAIPFFLISAFGILFARFSDRALIELLAILIGFLGSLGLANLLLQLPAKLLSKLFGFYVMAMGALSLICIVDFLFFPGLISSRNIGGLQGPFNNTGQAGSFFGVHAAICLALVLSGAAPKSALNFISAFCVAVALVLTLKRSCMIGFVVGIAGVFFQNLVLAIKSRKGFLKLIFSSALGIIISVGIFSWATDNVGEMTTRLDAKFSRQGIDTFDDFWGQNFDSSMQAFADSPLIGVGLGNVMEVYQEHEVHSTYLGVLAYGGVLGALTYAFFMVNLLLSIFFASRRWSGNVYSLFLYYIFPLFLGLMVSWIYTAHLRKREFWILVTFIVVTRFLAHKMHIKMNSSSVIKKSSHSLA